jgi:hypothetical protein
VCERVIRIHDIYKGVEGLMGPRRRNRRGREAGGRLWRAHVVTAFAVIFLFGDPWYRANPSRTQRWIDR